MSLVLLRTPLRFLPLRSEGSPLPSDFILLIFFEGWPIFQFHENSTTLRKFRKHCSILCIHQGGRFRETDIMKRINNRQMRAASGQAIVEGTAMLYVITAFSVFLLMLGI